LSLASARADPPSPVRQVIDGFLPEGISMMSAQFKAGKTTFGIDMASCLVSGDDFLECFEVDKIAGNVGYWNMEVDEAQMYQWQDQRVKTGAERFYTAHLRGKRMDLLHDLTAEWTVRWLKGHDIDVWLLDPMGRMLDEENSSSAFNMWFRSLEAIVTEAGVRATLLIHHSGHAGVGMDDAVPRARGASAMMGNTDCNIAFRHAGGLGEMPPDNYRYLSAFGRGVDLYPELSLEYDEYTRKYSVDDSAPSRKQTKLEFDIDRAVAAVEEAGDWELNKASLKSAMGGSNSNKDAAIDAAVRNGRLQVRQKPGSRAMFYAIP